MSTPVPDKRSDELCVRDRVTRESCASKNFAAHDVTALNGVSDDDCSGAWFHAVNHGGLLVDDTKYAFVLQAAADGLSCRDQNEVDCIGPGYIETFMW